MTEFCLLPLDTITKRRFWESLDNRSRSLLSDKPGERQWKRREWRRV